MASSITLYDESGVPVVVTGENIALSKADEETSATRIKNFIEITQAGYDGIVTKDPNTMYVIRG